MPSYHIRSIEEHLLPDPKPVYVITVFENFSRAVLASAISATQTQWDYLAVLADAIRSFGAPEALVTDGGTNGCDVLPAMPWTAGSEAHSRQS